MQVEPKYADADPPRRDRAAAAAHRPPGHDDRGRPGHRRRSRSRRARRSRSRRPSRTSTPTRSSPRSTATPAPTCSCCSQAGGEGLGGRGKQLSAGLRRFEPFARDLAAINGRSPSGAQNIARVITNFGQLSRGARRAATPTSPSSSTPRTQALGAFAEPGGGAPRDACGSCPSTLQATRRALAVERPALAACSARRRAALIPAAQALAPAQRGAPGASATRRSARSATRSGRSRARCSAPVKHLKQAAQPLAQDRRLASPARSATSTGSSTRSPTTRPAREEGYLFWTAWLNHNTNALLLLQDANGPLPRGVVLPVLPHRPARREPRGRAPVPQDAAAVHQRPAEQDHLPARPERRRRDQLHPSERRRELTMETRPPTTVRILIAVGFALSCFGLALFLWLAFGGPIPLKPEGYRFTVPFDEATQLAQRVRRADLRRLGRQGEDDRPRRQRARRRDDRDRRHVRADPRRHAGDPAPEDAARRDLRRADPGQRRRRRRCPRAARCRAAQVAESVQLDEIFRTFDEPTRAAFQAWMQGQAASLRGRGDDLSAAIASLDRRSPRQADRAAAPARQPGRRGEPARPRRRRGVRGALGAPGPAARA